MSISLKPWDLMPSLTFDVTAPKGEVKRAKGYDKQPHRLETCGICKTYMWFPNFRDSQRHGLHASFSFSLSMLLRLSGQSEFLENKQP